MTLIYYLVILIRIIKMTEESDENGKDKSKKLENKKIPSDFITSATASSPNQKNDTWYCTSCDTCFSSNNEFENHCCKSR